MIAVPRRNSIWPAVRNPEPRRASPGGARGSRRRPHAGVKRRPVPRRAVRIRAARTMSCAKPAKRPPRRDAANSMNACGRAAWIVPANCFVKSNSA